MKHHGTVYVPNCFWQYADTIRHENYKTNTPKHFQKHQPYGAYTEDFLERLGNKVGRDPAKLDLVYFSVAKGAEPHVDQLDHDKFEDTTFIIPVILPKGKSIIYADGASWEAKLDEVVEFDHTQTHSMTLEDHETGCVVLMVAVKKAA